MESLRYWTLALVLGCASTWASENFFWMMPPPGITPLDFCLTIIAYSIASAVALSAVIWSGLGGMAAAFLGGAIMGYMAEGVIVGTIYEAMPFQVVWTPLAWHGLITGGVVFGVGRAGFGPARMALIWVLLGLGGTYWAQYWVTEREGLPGTALFAFYVLALSLLVPLAHVTLDKMGRLPRPPVWVLWIAPTIAALVWGAQTMADMNPVRLVLPVILMLILWVMRRLGRGAAYLGPQVPAWQHLLFLIAPAIVVVLAPLGWAQGWGSLGANWVVAMLACLVSVIWLGLLIWRAVRGQRPYRKALH